MSIAAITAVFQPVFEGFVALKSAIHYGVWKVSQVAGSIFHPLSLIQDDTSSGRDTGFNAGFLRKVSKYVLPGLDVAAQRFGWAKTASFVTRLADSCADTADIFELARIVVPVNYFWNKIYKDEGHDNVRFAGEVAGAAADFTALPLALGDLELIDLAWCSEKLGNLRYLSFLTQVPLAAVSLGCATVAHGLFAWNARSELLKAEADADVDVVHMTAAEVLQMLQAKELFKNVKTEAEITPTHRTALKAALQHTVFAKRLDYRVFQSDLVLDGLLIAGVVSIPLLALAGTACVAFNLASLIHSAK